MKPEKDILSKIARHDGMTVPDGYFTDFALKMADSLPDRAELSPDKGSLAAKRTFWSTIRPYTYMAAMFAGVWCMLKLFTILSASPYDISKIESNPVMAEALNNEDFMLDYIYDDVNQWDVINDIVSETAVDNISVGEFSKFLFGTSDNASLRIKN